MKELKIKNTKYYEVTDATGEKLLLDKEKSGPLYFKGCLDYCFQNKLGNIEYDQYNNCYLYLVLEESIVRYFKDWVFSMLGIEDLPVTDEKNKWKIVSEKYKKSSYVSDVLCYKGSFDIYTILRYFYSLNLTLDTPWLDCYVELHNQLKNKIN